MNIINVSPPHKTSIQHVIQPFRCAKSPLPLFSLSSPLLSFSSPPLSSHLHFALGRLLHRQLHERRRRVRVVAGVAALRLCRFRQLLEVGLDTWGERGAERKRKGIRLWFSLPLTTNNTDNGNITQLYIPLVTQFNNHNVRELKSLP